MNDLGFLEKLLDGAEVEWVQLRNLASIGTGSSNRQDETDGGSHPFYVRSKTILKSDSYQFDETAIVVPGEGGIGDIFHFVSGRYALHQRAYRIAPNSDFLHPKYLFHWMSHAFKSYILRKSVGSTAVSIRKPMLEDFDCPIPCPEEPEKSLAIQSKIVRILDSFTELTAELTAELELRKKQYNHYRDQLLTFEEGDVEWKPLSALVDTVTAPAKLNRSAYREKGALPIVDQGMSFLAGYTDEDVTPVSAGEYVIFGDHSEHIKFVDFAFVQGADGLKILRSKAMSARFLFHAFTNHYRKEGNYKRHWSKAKETLIPVPFADDPEKSQEEQARIVAILDKFDTLTTSLSEGLPREIELRQKQYEYYRDLLLSFPKPEDTSKAAA